VEVTQDLIDESEEERFEEMPETSHLIDLPTCELNKLEEIADLVTSVLSSPPHWLNKDTIEFKPN